MFSVFSIFALGQPQEMSSFTDGFLENSGIKLVFSLGPQVCGQQYPIGDPVVYSSLEVDQRIICSSGEMSQPW